jgi:K+/H+ antiporter YhaU regulatory subunit KhtT
MKHPNGETVFDPDPGTRIEPGDVLIVIQKPHPETK